MRNQILNISEYLVPHAMFAYQTKKKRKLNAKVKKYIFIGYDKRKKNIRNVWIYKHMFVASQETVLNEVSSYYPLQVVSFENIIYNSKSDICSKLIVMFFLSRSSIDFGSSYSYVIILIISSSLIVEQKLISYVKKKGYIYLSNKLCKKNYCKV